MPVVVTTRSGVLEKGDEDEQCVGEMFVFADNGRVAGCF